VADPIETTAERVDVLLAVADADDYLVEVTGDQITVRTDPGWEPHGEQRTARQQLAQWRAVINRSPDLYADWVRGHGGITRRDINHLTVEAASAARELWVLLKGTRIEGRDGTGLPVSIVAVTADGAVWPVDAAWGNTSADRYEIRPSWQDENPQVLEVVGMALASRRGWTAHIEDGVLHARRDESRVKGGPPPGYSDFTGLMAHTDPL